MGSSKAQSLGGSFLPGLRAVVVTLDIVLGTSERSMESGIPGRLQIGRKEPPRGDLGERAEADFLLG